MSLGEISKGLLEMSNRLAQIEQHPALRETPANFEEAVTRTGSGAIREAINQFDQARRDIEAEVIGSARAHDRQCKGLTITARSHWSPA